MKSRSAIVGTSVIRFKNSFSVCPFALMERAARDALEDAGFSLCDVDGLIACPATIGEPRFMPAHVLASRLGILHDLRYCNAMGTGGAGPVSALLEADRLIKTGNASMVIVAAADTLASIPPDEMVRRIGRTINHPQYKDFSKPIIPILYDRIARWHMEKYGTKREHLAMVSVLMSYQGSCHPLAANKRILSLDDVLGSKQIAEVTTVLECARPADGGGAFIVVDSDRAKDSRHLPVSVLGGGEAARHPFPRDQIAEEMFPARSAAEQALKGSGIQPGGIRWSGVYDCFPIVFIKFFEEVGLVGPGEGGLLIESCFKKYQPDMDRTSFPVNTHGGLLSFGAPWEAPAIFSVVEAVEQMRGRAGLRQVVRPSPALVYGNGGIFSHAAIAILSS